MHLSFIALRNVQRQRVRALLLVVMITAVVAVVTALYLVGRSAGSDLADTVDEYGANITVVPASDQLPLVYGGVRVGDLTYDARPLTMDQVGLIRTISNKQNINLVAPKLLQLVEVEGHRVTAVGVQWDQELALKQWWTVDGVSPEASKDVLLGSRAAALLGKAPGADMALGGEAFTVTGVLQPTGTQEDDVLFMDLATAQRLWERPGEVSFVEVSAWCSSCPIEDITAQISTLLPTARVSALRRAMESRELLVGQFRLFSLIISVFMVLAGCLVVLASTLAGVRERKNEIGVFRALGYRRRHIVQVVMLENVGVALVASFLGVGIAWAAAGPLARLLAGVPDPASPDVRVALLAAGTAVIVVVLSSLYPAWVASRLSPLLALRKA